MARAGTYTDMKDKETIAWMLQEMVLVIRAWVDNIATMIWSDFKIRIWDAMMVWKGRGVKKENM
jgi:hypothetical protein